MGLANAERESWENAMLALDSLSHVYMRALRGAQSLEDKLDMSRCQKAVDGMRSELRAQVYQFEDAIEHASKTEYCDECGNLK